MLDAASWVERIGYQGAQLRRKYLFWRWALLGAIPVFLLCDVGLAALHLNNGIETTAVVLVVVSVASVVCGVVRAYVVTQRTMVAEILRKARLPPMNISDRSLSTIAGYDNWIGRVGSLAHPAP